MPSRRSTATEFIPGGQARRRQCPAGGCDRRPLAIAGPAGASLLACRGRIHRANSPVEVRCHSGKEPGSPAGCSLVDSHGQSWCRVDAACSRISPCRQRDRTARPISVVHQQAIAQPHRVKTNAVLCLKAAAGETRENDLGATEGGEVLDGPRAYSAQDATRRVWGKHAAAARAGPYNARPARPARPAHADLGRTSRRTAG
jgi:hypothetical protein